MNEETALQQWFCREVLPLEAALMRFIARNWRAPDEVADIRQDVYERLLARADKSLPDMAGPYVFMVARNVLINRARRAQIVSFELVADLDTVPMDPDWLTPARHAEGKEAVSRLQAGLVRLPPRCREVVMLRKVEGFSTKETASRLGIGIDAVEKQITLGMRALANFMLGGDGIPIRSARKSRRRRDTGHV